MNKLSMVLVGAAVLATGCSRGEEAQMTVAEEASALDKQADIQAAVGDKAGAKAMNDKAADLRSDASTDTAAR
jgi:hypothetical protein